MRPLVYLTVRRFVNSLKRLPKNPRLLIPVIFFALILVSQIAPFVVLRFVGGGSTEHHHHLHKNVVIMPEAPPDPAMLVASMKALLIVSLVTAIISALGDGTLFFELSDVDFLFPAPLSRRAVLFFRMLRTYLGLAIAALYFPFIMSTTMLAASRNFNPLTLWPGAIGACLFLITGTNLAQAGVILRWDRDSGGATPEQRRRVATASFVLIGLLAAFAYFAIHQESGASARAFKLSDALALLNGRATSLALAPISWAADLFRVPFEGWTGAACLRVVGLLALAAGSFVVLFMRQRDFYEGATEVSARRVRTFAAARRGDSSAMLTQMAEEGSLRAGVGRNLRSFGGGPWAVIWRDVIAVGRMPFRSWVPLLVIAVFPAFFGHIMGPRNDFKVLAWMVMFCVQMSSVFLVSARMMLRRADISKALPIGPVRFLLAEQAISIAQLTLLGWLSLTLMVLFGGSQGPFVIVAYLVFPTLTTLIIFVQTSFVLLYPQQNDAAQNIVGNILGLIVSLLAVVPCIVVGFAMLLLFGSPPYLIGLAAAATNAVCATGAVLLAGFLWERFDPTG